MAGSEEENTFAVTFYFPETWREMMPAYGIAIASFLDAEGQEQFGTGHLETPSIAQVVGMTVWAAADAKRQLMGDPPYDEDGE